MIMAVMCSVEKCDGKHLAKGFCQKHYWRNHRHGHLNQTRTRSQCSEDECEKIVQGQGLCGMHYALLRRNGSVSRKRRPNGDPSVKLAARERTKQWKKENWGTYKVYLASRKARVKLATPKWADRLEIQEIYASCPQGFHVDHIVPLNGKIVSGLHVPWNLQHLEASENMSKGRNL